MPPSSPPSTPLVGGSAARGRSAGGSAAGESAAGESAAGGMAPGLLIPRAELRVGALLAEGGEGRVFELVDRPGVLFKEYRRPVAAGPLAGLVDWLAARGAPGASGPERVRRATAWPTAVVVDATVDATADGGGAPGRDAPPEGAACGLLLPRAPRRFSLRHRDGVPRLATLSYLTADPVRRAAAYGLVLPAQGDPARIGLVYALARVLEVLEQADPAVGHGDLSAKNVLWSTQRGPEVFLLDCDNGERFDRDGAVLGPAGRRRAMTPNWDDPAVAPGANPGPGADRYSLALIFLRIVGAGHFPVQKRQKEGEAIDIEIDLPPPVLRSPVLAPDAPLWALVSRTLSVADPDGRPPASTWAAALHDVLVDLGASSLVDAVHSAHGGAASSLPEQPIAGPAAPDVRVRPRPARPRAQVWTSGRPASAAGGRAGVVTATPLAGAPAGGGQAWSGATVAGSGAPGRPGSIVAGSVPVHPPLTAQARAGLHAAFVAWLGLHRRTARALATPGRRAAGARRVVACGALDLLLACVGLLLVAMVVSPFLGI